MKKSLIIVSAIAIGLAIGGGIYVWYRSSLHVAPSQDAVVVEPTPVQEEKIWKDQSGFTFTYPADIIVDQHDEDQNNYAHVELTHPNHPGSLIVWVKDVPAGVVDAAQWVKKDKVLAAGTASKASLGGEVAQRVNLENPTRAVVGTVYDDALWYVEAILADNAYWNGVFERAHTSFAFAPVSDAPSGASSVEETEDGAYEEAVDEEEIIE